MFSDLSDDFGHLIYLNTILLILFLAHRNLSMDNSFHYHRQTRKNGTNRYFKESLTKSTPINYRQANLI